MKKIGLIIVSILLIGGSVFYIVSNEQPEQQRVIDTTEESKNFFDFRPSPNGSASSDSSANQTESSSSIGDQTIDSCATEENVEDEKKSLAFLDVNNKLFEAYYGEGSSEDRSQQLRNILDESLHSEYISMEDGEVFSGVIDEFSYQSFYNQQEESRATVVNVLEMIVDGLEQRILATVELEFDGKWLISVLKFELIYG